MKSNCCKNCKYSQKRAYLDIYDWPCSHPNSLRVPAHFDELRGGTIPDNYSPCGYFRAECKGKYFEEKKHTIISWFVEQVKVL